MLSRFPRRVHFAALLAAAAGVVLADGAFADPAGDAARVCGAATPREAAALAEKLYQSAEYQRAGACYQAAGDMAHANLAYLKAAGPKGEDTARSLKAQGDAAKSLFASVEHALHKNH